MHMKFIDTRVCVLNCFPFLGGRRGPITLGHILRFFSGPEKEPLLEFQLHPSIVFVVSEPKKLLPTSNTCINQLNLPRASQSYKFLNQNDLFKLYDFALSNQYFGQM